jgi:hypothetical protein
LIYKALICNSINIVIKIHVLSALQINAGLALEERLKYLGKLGIALIDLP